MFDRHSRYTMSFACTSMTISAFMVVFACTDIFVRTSSTRSIR